MKKEKLFQKYSYEEVDKVATSILLYTYEPQTDFQFEVYKDHFNEMKKKHILVAFTSSNQAFGFFGEEGILEIKKN